MEITVDCAAIASAREFHEALKQALGLPAWYGHNLDAMHDCLTELACPTHLTLDHFSCLKTSLGDYAGKLLYVLHICAEENPDLEISLEN